jgi:hypothetical protein
MSPDQHDLDTAWNRRFSGSRYAGQGSQRRKPRFSAGLEPDGWLVPSSRYDSFRDGHYKIQRNYGKGKGIDDFLNIILSKKETAVQTNFFLTYDILFSVDGCLLMGGAIAFSQYAPEM